MGLRTTAWHYGLMIALSLVIVSAFESVGAILAVAMLIVPAMFAAQLSSHFPTRLVLTIVHATISAIVGYHLSVWLNCSAAAVMVVSGSIFFALAWGATAIARRKALAESAEATVPIDVDPTDRQIERTP
jgi:ABC-type Mn2+/Zn2+ transport system permease subunit